MTTQQKSVLVDNDTLWNKLMDYLLICARQDEPKIILSLTHLNLGRQKILEGNDRE